MGAHYIDPKPKAGRFTVEYRGGGVYVVLDPSGNKVGSAGHRDQATELRDRFQTEADAKGKRGPRPCMCCGETFHSEGVHNRMCGTCRLRGSDVIWHSFGTRRRR